MKMRWSSVIWMQGKFRFSGKKLSHPLSGDNLEQKHDFWKNNHKTQFYPDLMSEQKCNLRLPLKITRRLSHIFEETSSVVKKLIFEEKSYIKQSRYFVVFSVKFRKLMIKCSKLDWARELNISADRKKLKNVLDFSWINFQRKVICYFWKVSCPMYGMQFCSDLPHMKRCQVPSAVYECLISAIS